MIALDQDVLVLGRHRDCDIVVRDPRVSRRHVSLEQTRDGFLVRRCEGAAAIYVNHREVDAALLRVGDVLRVGLCCVVAVAVNVAEGRPLEQLLGDRAALDASITPLWDAQRIELELRCWLQGHADVGDIELLWRGSTAAGDGAAESGAPEVRQRPMPNGTQLEIVIPRRALAAVRLSLRQREEEVTPFLCVLFKAMASVCALVALEPAQTPEDKARGARPPSAMRARYIGSSTATQRLDHVIARVARSDAAVLLVGESGTGKSLVARLLHEESARAGRPFHAVNCAAIPESLIESELFGHTRGAFTGAVETRAGAFETAGNGTIFLDEVAELPLASQAKLLRVLEERSYQRIGSSRQQQMEARVVAATNSNLMRMVEEGRMRADLYYRLSVVRVPIPPLRERGDDVMLIAEQLLRDIAQRDGRSIAGFSPEAVKLMRAYKWPGNVRELRNAIEAAVVFSEGPWIEPRDLSTAISGELPPEEQQDDENVIQLPMSLAQLESKAIKAALNATNGNRTRAASLLGINRVTLYKKLCQWPSERAGDEAAADADNAVG